MTNDRWCTWRWRLLLVVPLVVALPLFAVYYFDDPPQPAKTRIGTKLAVLAVFDQFRYDYLEKWDKLYGSGGFQRFKKEGTWFTNCKYPYALTVTAAGHTSLVTGTLPAEHGIIANRWYDPMFCKGPSEEEPLDPPPDKEHLGEGPYRRRPQVETIGDVLLKVLGLRGRVVSLGIKERAAILMAALRAKLCFWFETGRYTHPPGFRRSRYYSDGEPDPKWVREFNHAREKVADRWRGKAWDRLGSFDYTAFSGPDNVPGEGTGYSQGREFPHPFMPFQDKDAYKYYEAVTFSPMGNELLWEFAKAAIEGEKLGQGEEVDLLCLGFSSNDLVGHCWGPDSHEVLDTSLRTDVLLAGMIDYLDAKVGRDHYVLVVSSDHGVCPLLEMSEKAGRKIDRLPPDLATGQLDKHLSDTFLKGKAVNWQKMKTGNPYVYLDADMIRGEGLNQAVVARAAAAWLAKQPGMLAAYTREDLLRRDADLDPIGKMVQNSFDPACPVDVIYVLKPYHLMPIDVTRNETYRTTHGSPHDYDTHVPLLVLGSGIAAGRRDEAIAPQAAASILAAALGLPPPNHARYAVPAGLFKE